MQKTVAFSTLGLAAVLLAGTAYVGDTAENDAVTPITFNGDNILSYLKDGEYVLNIENGNISVRPSRVSPTPTPIPTPNPTDSLKDVVKKNLPVNDTQLDLHRRSMAFGIEFLKQAVLNTDVSKARLAIREFCDSAVKPDELKWVNWWKAVDAKLDSMNLTPQTYQTALNVIASALVEDLSDTTAVDSYGDKTLGLPPEIRTMLMEFLVKFLMRILGGL